MNAFDEMLSAYEYKTAEDKLNAIREVMQQVALCGLERGGFFGKAAFYGGTCLRIFHGLKRFSEDMDFSLLESAPDFDFSPYLNCIEEEFASVGQKVSITLKKKTKITPIQSAFLKSDTALFNLSLERGRIINIKLEVDTTPPLDFATEDKLLLLPRSFYVRCFTLPCLFAGKMHALLFRSWKNRVKGRDWYDFEWYVRKGVALDFTHFCRRAYQFSSVPENSLTMENFQQLLLDKIRQIRFSSAIDDVRPFIREQDSLQLWSSDYFEQVASMMRIQN